MNQVVTREVHKSFASTTVLRGIDLSVETGAFLAVLGQSGSGKTTLLRLIAGFERVDRGTIELAGVTVENGQRSMPSERRRIGYVPQDGALFPHLNVAKNVGFGLAGAERSTRVRELLELVGLRRMEDRYPHQLSGGQQQRVALARALAVRPTVVLLDEPFSALDPALRASLRADVRTALSALNVTTILVTHDQDEALSMADRVAVIQDGIIAQEGTPEAVYSAPISPDLARFVGDANIIPGVIRQRAAETALGTLGLREPGASLPEGTTASVLIRPEQLDLVDADSASATVRVEHSEYFGHDTVITVSLGPEPNAMLMRVRSSISMRPEPGSTWGLTTNGTFVAWPL